MKKLYFLLALLFFTVPCYAADTAISHMSACSSLTGTEVTALYQSGAVDCKQTVSGLATFSKTAAFAGSTAVTSSFSATPTFNVAPIVNQSPDRFEPGAMTANVTSVAFINKTAGAKFSIAWLQDGTGNRTVTYGASVASNTTCGVPDPGANVLSIQQFEIAADGSTVNCTNFSTFPAWRGIAAIESSSAPTALAGTDFIYADSATHRFLGLFNGGSAQSIVTLNGWPALTDGATVTWALTSAPVADATLTFTAHSGSRTLNITNPVIGGNYVLKIIQDGTGGEGLTLGTGCTWKVSGGGSGAITPSAAANAQDILAFTYDGTNCYANFNKNFN